ncbi:MAG: hypothetical protein H6Q19_1865 [Bacteroidetes bacterium]|nr:hypothetical protein [Bacteroidota bacterium]
MASRRKLKKTMQFIASELITDVFFKTLLSKKDVSEKADILAVDISKMATEFRARADHYDSKNNPKLVKDYYRKVYSDWNAAVEKMIKDIDEL